MKKGIIGLLLLGVAGGIGWQVYERLQEAPASDGSGGGWGRGGGNRNAPVAVEVTPVERRDMRSRVVLTGTLEPESRFLVAPKVGGRLERLLVEMGDSVRKGQLVANLDDAEAVQQTRQAEAALKTAQSSLEAAEAAATQAERELNRQRDLFSRGLSSQTQLENAESQHATRQANLRMAQSTLVERRSSLEGVKIRLSYTQIQVNWEDEAPTRVIGERFVDPGSLLSANAPILSVLNLSVLTAVVSVTEIDYFKLRPGQTAEVNVDALPGRAFLGKILRVAPFLQENSREARVEVEVPNPENLLKPGMFVRVQVELERHNQTVAIPLSSVVDRGGKGVYVADREAGTAQFVKITAGIQDGEWLEVLKPELSGVVVTLGQHLLRDGAAILIAEPGKAASGGGRPGGREGGWQGRPGSEGRGQGGGRPRGGGDGAGTGKRPPEASRNAESGSGAERRKGPPESSERGKSRGAESAPEENQSSRNG